MLNPFCNSSGSRSEAARFRREKFKVGFVSSILTAVVLFAGILIEGCHSQRGEVDAPATIADLPPTNPTNSGPAAAPVPGTSASPVDPAKGVASAAVASALPASPPKVPGTLSASGPERMYIVEPGDTLFGIARNKSTTVQALKTINELKTDRIDAGQKLRLPAPN